LGEWREFSPTGAKDFDCFGAVRLSRLQVVLRRTNTGLGRAGFIGSILAKIIATHDRHPIIEQDAEFALFGKSGTGSTSTPITRGEGFATM
jgi:hypothetical protein